MDFIVREEREDTLNLQASEDGLITEIQESPTEIIAVIKIPGVQDKKDIQIDIHNNTLNIRGDIKKSFNLPCAVNEEVIRTYYEEDSLEIRLQKTVSDNKKININIH